MARLGLAQALAALALQKDPSAVEAKVNQLLAAFPKEPLLLAISADLAARQGHLEQAMTLLDRADGLQPNSLLVIRAKAGIRLQMGQAEQALAEAERALRIDPRDVSSRLLAAQAQLARNEPQAALASVERVLAGQPKLIAARLLGAEILRRLGRGEEAAADLHDLIVQQPDALPAYTLAADIYVQQKHGEKALEILSAAQQRFPAQPLLGEKKIAVLCRLGRPAEAEKLADELAGPKPAADLCLALGAIFLDENNLTAARHWAEQAVALGDKPRQTAGQLLLGNIMLLQGRRTKDKALLGQSRDCYGKVLDNQPENLSAANNLAWLLAVEFGQPEKAREVVNQVLAKTSSKQLPATVAETFALVYREAGHLDAAQQIVDEALRRTPEMAALNFQAGLIYALKHRDDAAQAALRKAVRLGLPREQAAEAETELRRLEAVAEAERRRVEAAAEKRRREAEAEQQRREALRQAGRSKSSANRDEKAVAPAGG